MSFDELVKKINELFDNAEKRLKEIYEETRKIFEKGSGREAIRYWRHEIRILGRDLRRSLEDLRDQIEEKKLSEEELSKIRDYIRRKIDDFTIKLNETVDLLEEYLEEKRYIGPFIYTSIRRIPDIVITSIGATMRSLDKIIRDLSEEIIRITRVQPSVSTEVISSVRIRSEDLKIIDELVEGGIFKSRSEAVSYFTRRGIECSSEWINRALEQIKKIKELQESIKRDLEKQQ